MLATEGLSTIIGCVGGVLYWIFVICFFKYFGEEYAEMRYFQGVINKTQRTKFFLLCRKEEIERPRGKADFLREPQVKQAEQLNSNICVNNYPKTGGLLCAEPNVINPSSNGDNCYPRLPFIETDSQIKNIDNSGKFSHNGVRSDSVIRIRSSDQEDEEDSFSEEIVMIRRNVGVCRAEVLL